MHRFLVVKKVWVTNKNAGQQLRSLDNTDKDVWQKIMDAWIDKDV